MPNYKNEIVKQVKKFGNSGHVILPQALIGEKVRIRILNLDETKSYDLQRLGHRLNLAEKDHFDFTHGSKIYKRRLGIEYLAGIEAKILSLKQQIKSAQELIK